MAIKIKPSNIFDVQHVPIPQNAFQNVKIDETNYNRIVGDVTTPQTFTFYELEQLTTTPIDVIDKNNVAFYDDPGITSGRVVAADLTLEISQKTALNVNDSSQIETHALRIEETTWSATGGTNTVVKFTQPFYVSSVNEKQVQLNYATRILYPEESNGVDMYILRQTVSIEGQYFESTDATTAAYDDEVVSNNMIQLPTNELVQGENIYGSTLTNINYSDKFVAEVFDRYKNGKETATLLCSVGKYYDLEENLVVDAENEDSSIPPLLKKYDIVVPYVMTSRGEAPLSTDASGNPKQFQIIGVNISYNGVLRQEIVIQEYAT